jgi:hypothetical protein
MKKSVTAFFFTAPSAAVLGAGNDGPECTPNYRGQWRKPGSLSAAGRLQQPRTDMGDWATLGVSSITVDLNIIQVATWRTDRAVTLELLQIDDTGFNVNYDATYTLPDLP